MHKTKNKKGLSSIVTTLILIVLVLIAIGVVWVVIKNVIEKGAEEVSTGRFLIDLEIQEAVANNGVLEVTVKRNAGKGELQGLAFVVSNGKDSETLRFENISLKELEARTFSISYNRIIKKISVAPIIKTDSAEGLLTEVADKIEFSNNEIINNLGVVSWWRFEGNADDEVGNNNGLMINGVNCNAQGRFGAGCSFDGINDYVNVSNAPSLQLDNSNLTIVAWVYPLNTIRLWSVVTKGDAWNRVDGYGFGLDVSSHVSRFGRYMTTITGGGAVPLNQWSQIAVTQDFRNSGSVIKFYRNGVSTLIGSTSPGSAPLKTQSLRIGGFVYGIHFFNGTIDEVMIFNRELTANQIQDLYELELD